MRIAALICLCFTASLNSFALTLDDNFAGAWQIEFLSDSNEAKHFVLKTTSKTTADFSVNQFFGIIPVYELGNKPNIEDADDDLFSRIRSFFIAKNWRGNDHVVWLVEKRGGKFHAETNLIVEVKDETLILGSDFSKTPHAKMTRVAKEEL